MSTIIEKTTQKNQSTDKVFRLLEFLAKANEPLRLQVIAESLEMNCSTALRFLKSMESNGYIKQEPETKKYYLSMKICSLGYRLLLNNNLSHFAEPYMKYLSELFSEASCLSVEMNSTIVYIARHDSPDQMLQTFTYIGKRAPMHCTGSGKLFLTQYSDEELKNYVDAHSNIRPTVNTLYTFDSIKAELDVVRAKQYALDNEECEIGMRCIAIPVRNYTGKIIGGLSVTGPSARMSDEKISKHLSEFLVVSRKLSEDLGFYEW